MSREEVKETFAKYGIYENAEIVVLGSSNADDQLLWFLQNGKLTSFEGPDAYILVEDKVLIIEHFSIDGYEAYPNGGSKLQEKEILTGRAAEKKLKEKSCGYYTQNLGIINSYKDFLANSKARFDKHYRHIEDYKQKLIETGVADATSEITVCFLMDESSPLGTLTHDGIHTRPVCLGYSKEFLAFFEQRKNVDWIISAVVSPTGEYTPYFFSQKDVVELEQRCFDYGSYQFLSSDTRQTHFPLFRLTIPRDEKT